MDSYMIGTLIAIGTISVLTLGGIIAGNPNKTEAGIQSGGKKTKKQRKTNGKSKKAKK
jgi:hypothetical protein